MKTLLTVVFVVTSVLICNGQTVEDYVNSGYSNFDANDFNESMVDFNRAIELDANSSDAYYGRAMTKSKLGDKRGAMADYTSSIQIEPSNYAYYNRGCLKHELGDHRGAIADYSRAIELDSNDVKAYNNRGFLKRNFLDYRGALLDFNKVIELEPNSSEAYFQRGLLKLLLEQKNSGCLDLSKAGELGHPNAYLMIGSLCN